MELTTLQILVALASGGWSVVGTAAGLIAVQKNGEQDYVDPTNPKGEADYWKIMHGISVAAALCIFAVNALNPTSIGTAPAPRIA